MDRKNPLNPGSHLLALILLFHPLATKPKGRPIGQCVLVWESRSFGVSPHPIELWETKSQAEVTRNKTGTETPGRGQEMPWDVPEEWISCGRNPMSKCKQEKEKSEDDRLKKESRLSTGIETPLGRSWRGTKCRTDKPCPGTFSWHLCPSMNMESIG